MCEYINGAIIQEFPCDNTAGEELTLPCKNPSSAVILTAETLQQNAVTVCSERVDRTVVDDVRLASQFFYAVLHQYVAAVCNVIESFSHAVRQDYLIDVIEPV